MKLFFAFALCIGLASVAYSQNWPSSRGQNGSGVGESNALPATWDAEKSINVAWKTPIPGLGHSSPIVWGDRIFVTTAVNGAANSQFVHGPTETAVAADGKVYFASEDGDVFVIKAGPTFELLARNSMGEVVMASPAITGKMIIIRGQQHVFGIAQRD